jgi:hypothetical protein
MFLEFALSSANLSVRSGMGGNLLPFASSHIALSLERSGPPAQLMNIRAPLGPSTLFFASILIAARQNTPLSDLGLRW